MKPRKPIQRKTGLKRSTKRIKRSPIKKKPKKKSKAKGSKYWRNKADKEITRLLTGQPCKICGVTYKTCGHHLIPKSRCAIHRHTLENLYPLCRAHHMYGQVIAAHSQSAMVMQRFINWMEDHDPERLQWMREHEFDKGKPDYKVRYEYLKDLERSSS